MLEMTGTIKRPAAPDPNKLAADDAKNEQVLDTLKVERERGITVRTFALGWREGLGHPN